MYVFPVTFIVRAIALQFVFAKFSFCWCQLRVTMVYVIYATHMSFNIHTRAIRAHKVKVNFWMTEARMLLNVADLCETKKKCFSSKSAYKFYIAFTLCQCVRAKFIKATNPLRCQKLWRKCILNLVVMWLWVSLNRVVSWKVGWNCNLLTCINME